MVTQKRVHKEKTARRVTIMLDGNISKKLRSLQSAIIKSSKSGCSFSKVLNDMIRLVPDQSTHHHIIKRSTSEDERVTIMIDKPLDAIIRTDQAREILQCVKDQCELPSTSYSRVINRRLDLAFKNQYDKDILMKL